MAPVTVGIVGGAGETGKSIVNGLLEAGGFTIVALTRPSSISKPGNAALKEKGLELRPLDLTASQDEVAAALKGIDVLISAVGATDQLDQIPLATAAKTAGVKRFLPCAFITVAPVGGVHVLRDQKEEVYNHIKRLSLPYTIVDVGWWYQIAFPPLPSGRIDYAVMTPETHRPGRSSVPNALTDLRDIGRYVARIIVDDRTLNKYVFTYNEIHSYDQVCDLLERLSGEKVKRKDLTLEELEARIADADAKSKEDPGDFRYLLGKVGAQYLINMHYRGDNTPDYARYLGYVTSKELYPDFEAVKFEDYLKHEVLAGSAPDIYTERKAQLKAMLSQAENNASGH